MSLIDNASGFEAGRGSMAGYLCGIARNHLRRMLERNRPYVAVEYNGVHRRNAAVRFAGISYAGDAGLLDVLMGTARLRLNRE